MKNKIKFLLILVVGLMFVNFSDQTLQGNITKQQTLKYTCSMHPEVIQDMPGNCPKCGMKLVEKKEDIKENKYQAKDSGSMKSDHKKVMCDSINKGYMKNDSTSVKHPQKGK
jgi:hypothetical protein